MGEDDDFDDEDEMVRRHLENMRASDTPSTKPVNSANVPAHLPMKFDEVLNEGLPLEYLAPGVRPKPNNNGRRKQKALQRFFETRSRTKSKHLNHPATAKKLTRIFGRTAIEECQHSNG